MAAVVISCRRSITTTTMTTAMRVWDHLVTPTRCAPPKSWERSLPPGRPSNTPDAFRSPSASPSSPSSRSLCARVWRDTLSRQRTRFCSSVGRRGSSWSQSCGCRLSSVYLLCCYIFFLCLFLRPTSCRSRVDSRLPVPFLLLDRLPLDTKGRRCTSGQTCSPSCVRPSYLSLSIAYLCFSLFLFVLSAVCREFECADVS